MWSSIDDTGRNLAKWLREVARGQRGDSPATGESAEAVLKHLEARTGRTIRSEAAVDGFLRDLAAARTHAHKQGMWRGILRGALLLLLLVAAFLHYYYWSVNLEIASLPGVQVFGVKRAPRRRGATRG
jgi:hypothetical protein